MRALLRPLLSPVPSLSSPPPRPFPRSLPREFTAIRSIRGRSTRIQRSNLQLSLAHTENKREQREPEREHRENTERNGATRTPLLSPSAPALVGKVRLREGHRRSRGPISSRLFRTGCAQSPRATFPKRADPNSSLETPKKTRANPSSTEPPSSHAIRGGFQGKNRFGDPHFSSLWGSPLSKIPSAKRPSRLPRCRTPLARRPAPALPLVRAPVCA